jgi:hypothetical protein
MGKITNMQTQQNSNNGINLSYIRKQNTKPKLQIKGFKDLATLVGPTASNYRLTKYQRNFQKGARLTLAAIAASIAIGGAAVGHSISNNNVAETQEVLQQDELMETAENKLLECVFGESLSKVDNPAVSYRYDKHDGSTALIISSGQGDSKKVLFSYSKELSLDGFLNAKEISSLIDNTIAVHYEDEASQKQLKALNEAIEKTENKNFKLKDNHIVEDKQIDLSEER